MKSECFEWEIGDREGDFVVRGFDAMCVRRILTLRFCFWTFERIEGFCDRIVFVFVSVVEKV